MAYREDQVEPRMRRAQPKPSPMPQSGPQGRPQRGMKPTTGTGIQGRPADGAANARDWFAKNESNQSPQRPRANPMPGQPRQGGGMRADLLERVGGLPGVGANDRNAMLDAIRKGGRAGLKDAVRNQPYAQDVLQAINGNIGAEQNPMGGARPAGGAGVPGISSGNLQFAGRPLSEKEKAANRAYSEASGLSGEGARRPAPTGGQSPDDSVQDWSGGQYRPPAPLPGQTQTLPPIADSQRGPIAASQLPGAPAQPGSDTALPANPQVPDGGPQGGPVANASGAPAAGGFAAPPPGAPSQQQWADMNAQIAKLTPEQAAQLRAQMQAIPQGTGGRYELAQKFIAGLGSPQGVPNQRPPVTQTPPINPLPPQGGTQTPPIYVPPSAPPQTDPKTTIPDIFLPF